MAQRLGTHPPHRLQRGGTSSPGLQRINLADGSVDTIVTGTTSCDPIRRTAWGTIVFGEEAGTSGQLYELIDPLHTTGVTLTRATGIFSGGTNPQNLVRRDTPGRLSYEGLGLLPNGVLYYGDELRPSMQSDGCIRVATLNELTAESTGGIFNADGSKYYASIQHNVTGHGVVLEITGWK